MALRAYSIAISAAAVECYSDKPSPFRVAAFVVIGS